MGQAFGFHKNTFCKNGFPGRAKHIVKQIEKGLSVRASSNGQSELFALRIARKYAKLR